MDIDTSKIDRSASCNKAEIRTGQVQSSKEASEEGQEEKMREDSFDRFDLATQDTPFAERVKKRMNR